MVVTRPHHISDFGIHSLYILSIIHCIFVFMACLKIKLWASRASLVTILFCCYISVSIFLLAHENAHNKDFKHDNPEGDPDNVGDPVVPGLRLPAAGVILVLVPLPAAVHLHQSVLQRQPPQSGLLLHQPLLQMLPTTRSGGYVWRGTMAYFWSEAKVVFTPRAEDVSCEENISRNAARFFGLIAN